MPDIEEAHWHKGQSMSDPSSQKGGQLYDEEFLFFDHLLMLQISCSAASEFRRL